MAAPGELEARVIDAVRRCCERWGVSRMTIDDVAAEAGVSRATIYRLFPGGRDTLLEAMRVADTEGFLRLLTSKLEGAATLEEILVRGLVEATVALRSDEHLQLVLLSEPGALAQQLTVEGLPQIVALTGTFLAPWLGPFVGDRSDELAEWLTRCVISYFLVPSPHVDLGDRPSAEHFVRRFVLPAFESAVSGRTTP
jgi:AcrR family transcriptional regulator